MIAFNTISSVSRVHMCVYVICGSDMHHYKFSIINSFNISKYISFSQHHTRSGSFRKLVQPLIRHNRDKQFYFNRLPHLWNSLPPLDLSLSYNTIRSKLKDIFWNEFMANFDPENNCTYFYSCQCPSCFSQPKSGLPSCVSTPAKLNHTL